MWGVFFKFGEGVCGGPSQWWVRGLEQYHYFINALSVAVLDIARKKIGIV